MALSCLRSNNSTSKRNARPSAMPETGVVAFDLHADLRLRLGLEVNDRAV